MTYSVLRRQLGAELSYEADMIISSYSGLTRERLVISDLEVPADIYEKIIKAAKRRKNGEPLQYILGSTGFYNLQLLCEKDVLIPRFDTETVVSEAIDSLPHGAVFADICCGSGCIACAVLYNRPDTKAVCVDVSEAALSLTAKNLEKYGLLKRAEIIKYDIRKKWDGLPPFDAVISNPPYIKTDELLSLPDDVKQEPALALDGGEDGLDFYRAIIKNACEHTDNIPHIIFETGYSQAAALSDIAGSAGFDNRVVKDNSGLDRVSVLTKGKCN